MLLGHGSLLRGADVLPTALAALEEWCTASERLDGVNTVVQSSCSNIKLCHCDEGQEPFDPSSSSVWSSSCLPILLHRVVQ